MDGIEQNQASELLLKYKELSARHEKLMREMTKIMRISDAQSRSLIRVKTELKALLDNARQGFLTFDSSLTVQKQYSEECRRLFGRKIGGLPFIELIYPFDIEQQELAATFLRQIFGEEDEFVRDSWMDLLPNEISLHGKIVQLEYKMISHPGGDPFCMVIMTDVTHEKDLETEVERERRILRMVVKAVAFGSDVAEAVSAYRSFAASPIARAPEGEGRQRTIIRGIVSHRPYAERKLRAA
ncbi:hypothetical protein SD70_21760 [Gordoniibacillus kamchatkensis]|uniref:PAC domain-containing protein n=1 Tax=Gordoniibacillus kamchatkensis TaxID=1590651 RepID=A0ABR5AE64_9BACL|nr:hypothetical protein [Paenibacillus sp. VKM B-2647]KIL39172.1 hypothetical protein SD70_21760 [Paenibacillus sp. VKM B-2647]